MQKITLAIILLSLVSCSREWNKEYVEKKCNKDFKNRPAISDKFNVSQIETLCDCVAEKMIAKYKSEAASSKDKQGATDIGRQCGEELMKSIQRDNSADGTDSTGNN